MWLRYASGAKAEITSKKQSPTLRIAVSELQNFWQGGIPVTLEVRNNKELRALGNEGYTIQTSKGGSQITIASSGEQGVLYGTYHLLRLQATGQLPESALQSLNISERPDYRIRILNHWDNLDGTIERGYAGHSLWKWDELPSVVSPRYEAYARANASIGINATVINNVNASPKILSNDYLQKVKVLADVFRPYGLKIYLSIKFKIGLFGTVAVGRRINESAPHHNAMIGPQHIGKHIGSFGMSPSVITRTGLPFGIRFHQKTSEIGNQRINLFGFLLPPVYHFFIQRIGSG